METVMKCGSQVRREARVPSRRRGNSRGFSLIELVIVVAISLVLVGIAVPRAVEALRQIRLRTAVSSLTGAIQSTRYQAIFHGCSYQIAFSAAAYNYQVSTEAAAAGGQVCNAAFANVGNPIPLAGSNVTLNAPVTLLFSPSGTVTATVGAANNIQLTAAGVAAPELIQVSNYGKITVTP
jgi:prepilin-type N-terminal cleavage/methylation domain-containing protein